MHFGAVTPPPKPVTSKLEINQVRDLLESANRPLVIAGGGIKSAQAEEALVNFAEKYQLPVIAAFRRQDIFPNNHEVYAGQRGLGTHKNILETLEESDVILGLATRLSAVTTQDYSIITDDKKLIHLDID